MAKTDLFKARMCPNLNCISIMMSFLTYITGFFMNFELLPILTDYAN
jgi:Mg2+ and Co2+ transporter CorA